MSSETLSNKRGRIRGGHPNPSLAFGQLPVLGGHGATVREVRGCKNAHDRVQSVGAAIADRKVSGKRDYFA